MRYGYYVITKNNEFWCPTKKCAEITKREFGGEIIDVAERDKRWAQQAKKSKTA